MPKPLAKNTLIKVMLATALPHEDNALTYIAGGTVGVGQLVQAPLRQKLQLGMVMGEASAKEARAVPKSRLRVAVPLSLHVPQDLQQFIPWVAKWYMEPQGAVLKMALLSLPATQALLNTTPAPQANTKKLKIPKSRHRLTKEQTAAAKQLIKALAEKNAPSPPRPFLLDGVTGSGKTEVYFEAVAETLKQGKQVLILLPEIVLSSAFETRFYERFGVLPTLWHSGISLARRREAWRAVVTKTPPLPISKSSPITPPTTPTTTPPTTPLVVAGARSALFLPFANLGLIIVDEEHDHSYRQAEGTRYHARDMAVVRARLCQVPLVLASATPSLESEVNADSGRYQRLSLSRRIGAAGMPKIECIDLRQHPPPRGHWLAPPLVAAMRDTLKAKQQVLLFLNRRGYAPMSLCRGCGHRLACRNCSAWLVTHSMNKNLASVGDFLQCHHCGERQPYPKACPQCQAEESLIMCGPGVERLDEEVAHLFPDHSRCVFSSDGVAISISGVASGNKKTTPAQTTKTDAHAFISKIALGEVDVVIGTQIIAKGHHFPHLTLVGVVDADLGLTGGDLRASETSWQLLMQVAGRAGRGDTLGRVLVQTAAPASPLIKTLLAGDRPAFVHQEKQARLEAEMPPFGRLAVVLVSASDERRLTKWAQELRAKWPGYQGILLLGPAPAPIYRLRGRYRLRFLLRCKRTVNLQQAIRAWLGGNILANPKGDMRCKVDIDPVNFL
ncbi:MAG: primosomal protein N' [Proteobacteria bacterium]|nr:primosomal protein N' [Pseudomonadota bacterium]